MADKELAKTIVMAVRKGAQVPGATTEAGKVVEGVYEVVEQGEGQVIYKTSTVPDKPEGGISERQLGEMVDGYKSHLTLDEQRKVLNGFFEVYDDKTDFLGDSFGRLNFGDQKRALAKILTQADPEIVGEMLDGLAKIRAEKEAAMQQPKEISRRDTVASITQKAYDELDRRGFWNDRTDGMSGGQSNGSETYHEYVFIGNRRRLFGLIAPHRMVVVMSESDLKSFMEHPNIKNYYHLKPS